MTSRERILAAVEHRMPDRVPVDLGATPSSGISAIAYGNLKKHLGLNGGEVQIYDVVLQLAQPEESVLSRFGVDVVLEKTRAAVGDVVDIIRFGDDLGANNGPLMSPTTYRQLFKPRHAKLCAYVHKHTRMKTFLHSCGSIRALMPDLIEAGFDIINPACSTYSNACPRPPASSPTSPPPAPGSSVKELPPTK